MEFHSDFWPEFLDLGHFHQCLGRYSHGTTHPIFDQGIEDINAMKMSQRQISKHLCGRSYDLMKLDIFQPYEIPPLWTGNQGVKS